MHYAIDRPGIIGLPVPACTLKMVPSAGKLSCACGPNVTPGYWRRDDLTAAAFDEEGFYRIGDAGRLFDDTRPQQGIVFDGRVAEDFKLNSGTWHVGSCGAGNRRASTRWRRTWWWLARLRRGHLLVFLGPGCGRWRRSRPMRRITTWRRTCSHAHVRAALSRMAQTGSGSSTHAARALLMGDAPDIDAGEITDKGYINQRAVLARRAALVEELFSDPPSARTVMLERIAGKRD